jgi:hypothetical protein
MRATWASNCSRLRAVCQCIAAEARAGLPAGSQRRAMQAEPGQRLACCRCMHGLGIGTVKSCGRLVGQPAHAPQALFGRLLHGLQHGRHILGSMGLQYALGLAKAMLQTGSTRLPGSGEIKNGFQVRSPASALSICAECYQTCYIHQPGIAGIKNALKESLSAHPPMGHLCRVAKRELCYLPPSCDWYLATAAV